MSVWSVTPATVKVKLALIAGVGLCEPFVRLLFALLYTLLESGAPMTLKSGCAFSPVMKYVQGALLSNSHSFGSMIDWMPASVKVPSLFIVRMRPVPAERVPPERAGKIMNPKPVNRSLASVGLSVVFFRASVIVLRLVVSVALAELGEVVVKVMV